VLASLADLPAEEMKWLWPGRIARGSVTLLVGFADVGKKEVEQEAKEIGGISSRSFERGRGALEVRAFRKKIPGPSWICLADWSEAEEPDECKCENLGGVGKNAGDFDDFEEKEAGGVGGVAKSTEIFEGFGEKEAGGVGGVGQMFLGRRSEVGGQRSEPVKVSICFWACEVAWPTASAA
jgi:hypothetical protein